MKNALTPTQGTAAVSEPWRAALRTFDADLQRRGAAERTRKAYGTDAAELAAWATANGLDPTEVDYKVLRRWAARLSQRARPRARWRASSRRSAASSAACSSTARSRQPGRPAAGAEAAADAAEDAQARTTSPRLLEQDPGLARRSSSAIARCSSWPTRAACAPRSSSTSTSPSIDFDAEQVRVEGKGSKTRFVPAGEHGAARRSPTYLERARPALRAPTPEPALFLSKSGRRLSTSDVRRRLRVWARHAAHADRRAPARPPSFLRHPPAGGRRGPARDPGDARSREYLDDPGLHSGRVRPATGGVREEPPAGVREASLETNVKAIELKDLWRRYKTDGSDKAREQLVVAYSPLVKYVAGRMSSGLPAHVEEADLISYGLLGPDQRDRALRPHARDQVRDLRDHAHQGRDHRRAARPGLGAAVGPRPRPRDREGPRQARAPAAPHADRRGDGARAEDHRRGVPGGAGQDLDLDGRRARRAVGGLGLLRRRRQPARHAARPGRPGPRAAARAVRGQGPPGGRDRRAARSARSS